MMRNDERITTIVEGKTDGKTGRGRPFTKRIVEVIGKTNYRRIKSSDDGYRWRSIEVIGLT